MAFTPQWICGFDEHDTTTLAQDFNGFHSATKALISTTTKRTGRAALEIYGDGSTSTMVATRTLNPGIRDLYMGFAYRPNTNGSGGAVLFLSDAIEFQNRILVGSGGELILQRGTVTIATTGGGIVTGAWNWVEFRIYLGDTGVGKFAARINGIEVYPLTTLDTRYTSSSPENPYSAVSFSPYSLSGRYWVDDVVIGPWDDTDGWPGDMQVATLTPASQGTYSGFAPTGAATALEAVDETFPNNDNDYIRADGIGARHTFVAPACPIAGDVVAVSVNHFSQTEANTRQSKSLIRKGTAEALGTAEGVNVGYKNRTGGSFIVNPATGLPFTSAEILGLEFGIELQ
jgi:hypothetical protein